MSSMLYISSDLSELERRAKAAGSRLAFDSGVEYLTVRAMYYIIEL